MLKIISGNSCSDSYIERQTHRQMCLQNDKLYAQEYFCLQAKKKHWYATSGKIKLYAKDYK